MIVGCCKLYLCFVNSIIELTTMVTEILKVSQNNKLVSLRLPSNSNSIKTKF